MIVNTKLNLVFIHCPKTAGISINTTLARFNRDKEVQAVHRHGKWGVSHAPYWAVLKEYPELLAKPRPLHFGVVRNPWDKAHSLFSYETAPRSRFYEQLQGMTFPEWMYFKWIQHHPRTTEYQWWYYTSDPMIYAPVQGFKFLRYEFLDLDWRHHVVKNFKHGVLPKKIPFWINKSGPPDDYRPLYGDYPECAEIVSKIFRKDIEAFGYAGDPLYSA